MDEPVFTRTAGARLRRLGLEQFLLSVRGGTGTEGFYARFGYTEIGRHPGSIRLAPGDDRDEIVMLLTL